MNVNTIQSVANHKSVKHFIYRIFYIDYIGKISMVLIEVQTGSYFGEDDIVRYEDLYKRV